MSATKLSQFSTGIVVPCYNEAERLQLSEFCGFLNSNDSTFFCFVNDGSNDGTQKILVDFVNKNPERSQVVNLHYNQGKAEAVRQGITTLLQTSKFQFDVAVVLLSVQLKSAVVVVIFATAKPLGSAHKTSLISKVYAVD